MSALTAAETQRDLPAMQADLADLLQLEFEALPVYALAVAGLRRPEFRETLKLFRTDHERHVQDLSAEIRRLGGISLRVPHLPAGLLKLGVHLAGLGDDDRTILLAFASNEWQTQEKYARYAALPYPPDGASLAAARPGRGTPFRLGLWCAAGAGLRHRTRRSAGWSRPSHASMAPPQTCSRPPGAPPWKPWLVHHGRPDIDFGTCQRL